MQLWLIIISSLSLFNLNTVFFNTVNLISSVTVTDQDSHPYKACEFKPIYVSSKIREEKILWIEYLIYL
jgi:hypothetical protein